MTDKQQPAAPPERLWLLRNDDDSFDDCWQMSTIEGSGDIEYARVHPVDDARVEEMRERRQEAAALEARRGYSHPLERPTWADVDYLLSLRPQPRLKDDGAASLVEEIAGAPFDCPSIRAELLDGLQQRSGKEVQALIAKHCTTAPAESSEPVAKFDVEWRRPNEAEVLQCQGLTADSLALRIRAAIRSYGRVELLSLTPATSSERRCGEVRVDAQGHSWEHRVAVDSVQCPHCLFTFDAAHTDGDSGGYSCPNCEGCPSVG